MPLITVAALPHPEELSLLEGLADAVADALDLGAGDVIAMSVPVRTTAVSGRVGAVSSAPWTLISIHGSDRGTDRMRLACDAARAAAADWSSRHDADREGVWCEWLLPQHP